MGEADMPVINYNRDRRRSSIARPMRDHEEILEGLRSLKAKSELARAMSLTSDKRRTNREYPPFSLQIASFLFLRLSLLPAPGNSRIFQVSNHLNKPSH